MSCTSLLTAAGAMQQRSSTCAAAGSCDPTAPGTGSTWFQQTKSPCCMRRPLRHTAAVILSTILLHPQNTSAADRYTDTPTLTPAPLTQVSHHLGKMVQGQGPPRARPSFRTALTNIKQQSEALDAEYVQARLDPSYSKDEVVMKPMTTAALARALQKWVAGVSPAAATSPQLLLPGAAGTPNNMCTQESPASVSADVAPRAHRAKPRPTAVQVRVCACMLLVV
jgi:hypothetical protein